MHNDKKLFKEQITIACYNTNIYKHFFLTKHLDNEDE